MPLGTVVDAMGRNLGPPGRAVGGVVSGTGKGADRSVAIAVGAVGSTVGTVGSVATGGGGGIGGGSRMKRQVFMLDEIGTQDRGTVILTYLIN
jgi:hypothetical protein